MGGGGRGRQSVGVGGHPWSQAGGLALLLRVAVPLSAGLGGGSASGKTTVARMIIEALDVPWVVLLSMDSFYKVRSCACACECRPRPRRAWRPRPGLPRGVERPTEPPDPSCRRC